LIRDQAFVAKRALLLRKHENERRWYQDQVVMRHEPTGPDLPVEPTP
jgi:hypothetical protein